MTVKQLIEKLKLLPQNSVVILQKDGEGNGFSPCDGAESAIYRADSTWSGEVLNEDDDYEKEQGDKKCVVLWPVN